MDQETGLPVVGMVGAGQLARMTHQAAVPLGLSLRVLATDPTESAARVCRDVRIGRHDDGEALEAFAAGCDVVTFDHEHVPYELGARLVAAGHTVLPDPEALVFAQDKEAMRRRVAQEGLPSPRWAPVASTADVAAFAAEVGWPVIVKAARGGYDGRGVWRVASPEDVDRVPAMGTGSFIAEELVPIRRELAALVARSSYGQVATWPVVETVQQDGICVEVVAPAPALSARRAAGAQRAAAALAEALGVVGVMAVELFDTGTDLLVNELAMRPHNSGHWTIDGSVTSQYEQHLRAVLDFPLGRTECRAPWTVMANVLGGPPGGMGTEERLHRVLARDPGLKVHWYGKQARPGRKLGHVTAYGDDLENVRRRAGGAAAFLSDPTEA